MVAGKVEAAPMGKVDPMTLPAHPGSTVVAILLWRERHQHPCVLGCEREGIQLEAEPTRPYVPHLGPKTL